MVTQFNNGGAMESIHKLIYERAIAKGIRIEVNPEHRHNRDYIGSGRRNVTFSDNNKVYSYTGTLIDIGIRLDLITESEYDSYILSKGKYIRCPKCESFITIAYVKQIGNCSNCDHKFINN